MVGGKKKSVELKPTDKAQLIYFKPEKEQLVMVETLQTGAIITIAEATTPVFKAGKAIKRLLNNKRL